ncbi:hypothetical protein [Micromonospora aurantiaca]|uniref:alpha-L-rhamnosidase-related protein n=1 Tax=Micromonospora aurantiaca (nom. illeg.) TaxID=47850 RepID=UPI0037FEB52D
MDDVTTDGRRPWTGRWIWCQDTGIRRTGEFQSIPEVDERVHDRRVLFRREFTLDRVPGRAPMRITADSRYVLWVNGVELARGPARSHPRRLLHDTVDAAPALRPGVNVVGVLVRFYGEPTAWWMPAVPTFSHGAGVLVAEVDLPGGVLGTDRTWRCRVSDAWTRQRPSGLGQARPEVLDGRRLDPEWLRPGHPDEGWSAPRVVTALHLGGIGRAVPPTDPYGPMPPRVTAPPAVTPRTPAGLRRHRPGTPGEPVTLPLTVDLDAGSPEVLTADFGRVVAGTLALRLTGPAGVVVDGSLGERLDGEGVPAPPSAAFSYTLRGHADTFETADPGGGRYAVLRLTGSGRVTVDAVTVSERLRPRPAGPFFTCSDPLLDEIHRVGLRTVDLTAQDAYIDCPTREQRAWTGDSVVHQAVDLVTNPDWRLARWHPRLAAVPGPDGLLPMAVACDFEHRATTTIPDWSLHWIRSVRNLWWWAGDRDEVAALLPVAEGVLRWFAEFARDGLLTDVTGWVLLDWASVQGRGAGAVLNGLWGRALTDFAEMAAWLGDHGRARWARAQHRHLAEAYRIFFDPARGGYRDWAHDGVAGPGLSDHAAAAAVVGGLVPAASRAAVLRFLLAREDRVTSAWSFGVMPLRAAMGPPPPDWDVDRQVVAAQPFFRYVVHDAVAALGGAEHVARLCRDWRALLTEESDTWPETWSGGSLCHGWSATPSRDLPLYTLGAGPAAPGFARARVAPRLGDLDWARGAVPTPHGLLTVEVGTEVTVESPVPVEIDVGGVRHHRPPGRWTVPAGREHDPDRPGVAVTA